MYVWYNLRYLTYTLFVLFRQIEEELSKEPGSTIDVEIAHKNAELEHMSMTVSVEKHSDARELLQQTMQAFDIQVLVNNSLQIKKSDVQNIQSRKMINTKDAYINATLSSM